MTGAKDAMSRGISRDVTCCDVTPTDGIGKCWNWVRALFTSYSFQETGNFLARNNKQEARVCNVKM